jgi:hypothetical protein
VSSYQLHLADTAMTGMTYMKTQCSQECLVSADIAGALGFRVFLFLRFRRAGTLNVLPLRNTSRSGHMTWYRRMSRRRT